MPADSEQARVLLVLLDGTAYREDMERVSAIGRLYKYALNDETQRVYYDRGVGTGFFKITGRAIGLGLPRNVRQAYAWISDNYLPGTRVIWVGWSRGAFTGRLLGGMLAHSGLTSSPLDTLDAWKAYRSRKAPPLGRTIRISLGLALDTVSALRGPYRFRDVFAPIIMDSAIHFVALDETRSAFEHTPWAGKQAETYLFTGNHAVAGGAKPGGLSDIVTEAIGQTLETAGIRFRPGYYEGLEPNPDAPIPKQARFWKWLGHKPRRFCPTAKPHSSVGRRVVGPKRRLFTGRL